MCLVSRSTSKASTVFLSIDISPVEGCELQESGLRIQPDLIHRESQSCAVGAIDHQSLLERIHNEFLRSLVLHMPAQNPFEHKCMFLVSFDMNIPVDQSLSR